AGRRACLIVANDVTELIAARRSMERYAARLALLHEIDKAIIAAQTPIGIAEPAITRLRELVRVPRAIVNIFDLEKNEVEWLVAAGPRRVHRGPGVRFPMTFMGDVEALRRGELQVVDTNTLPAGVEVDALLRSGVEQYVVVPMIAGGELMGALSFGGAPGMLSSEQIGIAQEVAAQIAIGIAHVRLLERVQRHAHDLERRVQERTVELNATNERLQDEIIERRRAEAEAARASRLKSEFLANMSHELRTPLNAILGFTELIHDGLVAPEDPQYKEFLGDILASGQHLLQLINDVLDLSKVEAGKLEFHPEPCDVAMLTSEVLGVLRPTLAAKAINAHADIDPSLASVLLDTARFKQVLYNYVSNAVKFTPRGGRVTVRARRESDAKFRLEVEDTGIGIAAADIARLFTEFQQLDSGTGKSHGGTGLGLALTKRLVEAQGGRVGVESTLGVGSVFYAVLPTQPRRENGAQSVDTTPVNAGEAHARVLVIDADPTSRAILTRTLAGAGYTVETAATGADALAACRERAFAAITVDLALPDMSGFEVLHAIRAEGVNGMSTPVLAISAVTPEGTATAFAVHDVLTKPVDPEAVLASLQKAGVSAHAPGVVLVVDDDVASLNLAAATLARLGLCAHCVRAGEEGLQHAAARTPIAVLLDLMMPQMSGFEFLSRFRALPSCAAVPVIIWTAKDLTPSERSYLRSRAQQVIGKGRNGSGSLVHELKALLARNEE
ncbi:MAG TPA: response regulator, partial [Casimicrobiaceae bacterium]|nr:response regulator [Casimicrobiaceae bacterium]